jgi:hypothetical protein
MVFEPVKTNVQEDAFTVVMLAALKFELKPLNVMVDVPPVKVEVDPVPPKIPEIVAEQVTLKFPVLKVVVLPDVPIKIPPVNAVPNV